MDEIQFKKEKGVSFATNSKKGKVAMAGYTVTFIKGSHLYMLNFSTTAAAMKDYYPAYFHALNTFDMHPSQMIVGKSKNTCVACR